MSEYSVVPGKGEPAMLRQEMLDEIAKLRKQVERYREALAGSADEIECYIGNPSAWDSYSENVSEAMRRAHRTARAALKEE